MKRIIPFLFSLTLLFSCGTSKEQPVKEISIETIQKGNLFGAGDEGFENGVLRIYSIDDWHDLVKKLGRVNVFETDFDAHSFDFEHNALYFCTDKVRSTGGHSLRIITGEYSKKSTTIYIHHEAPEEMAPEVLTQPYVIFSMEKRKGVELTFN